MQCYARSGESFQALKIFQLMKEKSLVPDVASYTTLINSFYKGRDLKKCWELFEEVKKKQPGPDEHLVGLMIEICAHVIKKKMEKNLD
jgi:pentatricopeptide repeat protein